MNYLEPIKISLRNLGASKLRSFLSILGIIIGVAAVIVIFGAGKSAQALILDQIKGIGSNLITVMPGASDEKGPPASALGITITTLKYQDLQALQKERNVPEVEAAMGMLSGTIPVEHNGDSFVKSYLGVTEDYLQVENGKLAQGRFFTEKEERGMARVVVLGHKVAEEIFEDRDPLGEKLEIKKQNYTVIGVLQERGSAAFGMSNQDDSVIIPLRASQKLIAGVDHLGYIRLKVSQAELVEAAKKNIAQTLRNQHNITDPTNDDFSVRDQQAALSVLTQITDVLRYFLLAIGAISLVVGGVGIMNIMLIAVSQRIREVGLRKALGARNSDIVAQFLVEAVAVSLSGGILGIVLGVSASFLISVIVRVVATGYDWPFLLSPISLLVATGVSIVLGILFGIYPAWKASKISPMEALRYE
jgi:putative ABC transport system permease protein